MHRIICSVKVGFLSVLAKENQFYPDLALREFNCLFADVSLARRPKVFKTSCYDVLIPRERLIM